MCLDSFRLERHYTYGRVAAGSGRPLLVPYLQAVPLGDRFWENDEIARSSVVADEVLDALEIRRDIIPVDTTLHRTDA